MAMKPDKASKNKLIDLHSIELMHGFKSAPFSKDGWIFELKWDGSPDS